MYIHRWHYHYFNRLYFAKKIFLKCFNIFFPRIRALTKFVKSLRYTLSTRSNNLALKTSIDPCTNLNDSARIYVHCIEFNHKQ